MSCTAAPEDHSLPPALAGDITRPGHFIGLSPTMRAIYTTIENAAPSKATIFITGESGTGKDVCAHTIHRLSPRITSPFIAINCAAIPAGLLESELFGHVKGAFTGAIETRDGAVKRAQGGTLFLDEICDMDLDMQAKLLRFIEDHSYVRVGGSRVEKADVRIICATNRSPMTEIEAGRFRHDLYYRLHVVSIDMPPLRGRAEDILDLADYFLHRFSREEGKNFSRYAADAESFLIHHDWPGNVRELQNMVHAAIVLHQGSTLDLSMLQQGPAPPRRAAPLPPKGSDIAARSLQPLWQVERDAIETAIRLCGGNIPRAAALLEISPSTIYRKKLSWEGRG